MAVIPVAQPLMLCEEIDEEGGAVNVYGLFNAMRAVSFPYRRELFGVFVQLRGGLGTITIHYDIVRARDNRTVHFTNPRALRFDRRTQLVQSITHLENIVFEEAGVYLVQLFCDNVWVADVALELLEVRDGAEQEASS